MKPPFLAPSPSMFCKTLLSLIFFSALFLAKTARAENEVLTKLMVSNNCMACHQIDKSGNGPQYNEVSRKYMGDKTAVIKLAAKIKSGGSGVWGEDMMPPQAHVSDADALTMAKLILALPPAKE
jgi:cytochrome c